jgi:hypothetical protein
MFPVRTSASGTPGANVRSGNSSAVPNSSRLVGRARRDLATVSAVRSRLVGRARRDLATVSAVRSRLVGRARRDLATVSAVRSRLVGRARRDLATVSAVRSRLAGRARRDLATVSAGRADHGATLEIGSPGLDKLDRRADGCPSSTDGRTDARARPTGGRMPGRDRRGKRMPRAGRVAAHRRSWQGSALRLGTIDQVNCMMDRGQPSGA